MQGIISPLSQELLGWEKGNKLSQRWQIFWRGEEFSEKWFFFFFSFFPPREKKSGNIRWCFQRWRRATEALVSSLLMRHCLVSMDHSIFVKVKPRCPSSLPVTLDDRLSSLDWEHDSGQNTHTLTSEFPQRWTCWCCPCSITLFLFCFFLYTVWDI